MGAAQSVQSVYRHAVMWYKNFVDKELYQALFEELDSSKDGGINYMELQRFIQKRQAKCKKDKNSSQHGPWQMFNLKGPVIMMAHKMASLKVNADSSTSVSARKQVDFTEMRAMLIQLYVFGVLWRHFAHAKHWEGDQDESKDAALQLSLPEFVAGCKSLAHVHTPGVTLEDEVLMEDFTTMDTNFTACVGFISICQHCYKYLLPANNPLLKEMNDKLNKVSIKIPKFFGKVSEDAAEFAMATANKMFAGMNTTEKEDLAFMHMADGIDREETKITAYYEQSAESIEAGQTFRSRLSVKCGTVRKIKEAPKDNAKEDTHAPDTFCSASSTTVSVASTLAGAGGGNSEGSELSSFNTEAMQKVDITPAETLVTEVMHTAPMYGAVGGNHRAEPQQITAKLAHTSNTAAAIKSTTGSSHPSNGVSPSRSPNKSARMKVSDFDCTNQTDVFAENPPAWLDDLVDGAAATSANTSN